ncbi:MAG: phosphoenolpyruvate--protein phosphotransferase [Spirochaetes bacterium GWB1_59_5]|nr:MAG: phosphoenolpyruvate--protein phosphotransferase [Spirochaetes bacterium GWB1_59_5]
MSVVIRGIAASPGIAIARVVIMEAGVPATSEQSCAENPDAELARYEAAVVAARIELEELRDRTRETLGELKAEIFQAHLSILKDPELRSEVVRLLREERRSAVAAVRGAEATFVELLSQVEDEMFKARIDDIKDLCGRIVSHLEGRGGQGVLKLLEPSIIVAADLTPSETAGLDRSMVKAFIIATGSAVSHSSILARSLGIPAVVGAGAALVSLRAGSLVIVDGSDGLAIVEPDEAEIGAYRQKLAAFEARREALRRFVDKPTKTRDGLRLELGANIGGTTDLAGADENGAEGVGLFRTEFMYMDRPTLPGEDEQYEVYRHVLSRMAPRPVVIRTLDVGGDKRLDCLPMEPEANPFLGVRAIRLCLANEGLFRTQLRALLRASTSGRLRIMFPMIATIEELRAARAVLDEERRALEGAGVAVAEDIEVGIMIEIPAAAVMADSLAAEVDFFSVGSNDLTQYAMAADRMNPAVAYLHSGPHPAVLRLIGMAAVAAKRRGIWIGLCGEMAADPLAAPLLVGMGISELSMGAAAIPTIRALLSETDSGDARRLYETARDMESAADVRRLMEGANA